MHLFVISVFATVDRSNISQIEHIGKEIGHGTFGRVLEMKCRGWTKPLAGKVLRDDLGVSSRQEDMAQERFHREYNCLRALKPHRNIVQYQGIAYTTLSRFPVLLMELMPEDLHHYLQRKRNSNLSVTRKTSILYEIAQGLEYLHQNRVIHRDLSARNVLMDSEGIPKISDLGNSRLLNYDSGTSTPFAGMTANVGTRVYMAPEVQPEDETADYSYKVDVFSFGHLALFVSLQTFPKSLLSSTYTDTDGNLRARTEVARRVRYFEQMPPELPPKLTELIEECLNNSPVHRPSSSEVKKRLENLNH